MKARIFDAVSFVATFRIRRVVNFVLLITSYYISRILKKPVQFGKPFTISVEPTTSCNLGCPQCPSGRKEFTRPVGTLKPAMFEKVMEEFGKNLNYLTFYFQGEPYINPHFNEMVAMARKQSIYVSTSTNGHFIDEANAEKIVASGLNRMIISVDGASQQTYEVYRKGGEYLKVIEGVKNLVKAKEKANVHYPFIILQFIVMKHNEHEMEVIKKVARETGVNEIKFKTAQVYDYSGGSQLIPENEKYSRYERSGEKGFKLKSTLYNHCWRLWRSCVITWNGDVVPCCFDKDAKYKMGNIAQDHFVKIWHGPSYKRFRSSLIQNRKAIDICSNCSEGTKVWL